MRNFFLVFASFMIVSRIFIRILEEGKGFLTAALLKALPSHRNMNKSMEIRQMPLAALIAVKPASVQKRLRLFQPSRTAKLLDILQRQILTPLHQIRIVLQKP